MSHKPRHLLILVLRRTTCRRTKRGERFRFSVYCHRTLDKFQKVTFERLCDVFCKISATGLMSLVGVLITWTFHKSCRWMSFTGKEFARVVFKYNCSTIALKSYLSVFDLKMCGCFASVIFGVSVLRSIFGSVVTDHPSGSITLIIMRKEATS